MYDEGNCWRNYERCCLYLAVQRFVGNMVAEVAVVVSGFNDAEVSDFVLASGGMGGKILLVCRCGNNSSSIGL